MWIGATSPAERAAHEEASQRATLARLDADRDAYWARQPASVSPLSSTFSMAPPRATNSTVPASSFDAAINTARLQRLLDTVLRAHPEHADEIERFLRKLDTPPAET